MSETVYILNHWPRVPVFHDYGRIKQLDIAQTGDVTTCGLVLYDGRQTRYSALLRREHAECFAVPCVKCFPPSGKERP